MVRSHADCARIVATSNNYFDAHAPLGPEPLTDLAVHSLEHATALQPWIMAYRADDCPLNDLFRRPLWQGSYYALTDPRVVAARLGPARPPPRVL